MAQISNKKVDEIFTRIENKIKDTEKCHNIYRVNCNPCELKYIDQSARRLQDKMVFHTSDIRISKNSFTPTLSMANSRIYSIIKFYIR